MSTELVSFAGIEDLEAESVVLAGTGSTIWAQVTRVDYSRR